MTDSQFRLKRDELGNLLTFVKGIAILFVMMHHFARSAWLSLGIEPPLLLQWEYIYPLDSYQLLYSALLDGNYWEASLRALANFGYFEFHLFILASGLGLALGTPEKIGVWALFRQRAAKIIPPFWLAVIVFASLAWLAGHGYSINQIVARMLMLTTFSGKDFFTIDSPLWCIALFLQLYLLFIPLRAVINRFGLNCIPALVVIAYLARWCASLPEVIQWNVHFGHVFALNWLGVFGLGIWMGQKLRRDGELVLKTSTLSAAFVLGLGLIVVTNLSQTMYPLHDSAVAVFAGVLALIVWRMSGRSLINRAGVVVGVISFPLFLYHRPIIAQVLNWWSAKTAATSLPPPYMASVLLVIILAMLLAQRVLRNRPQLASLLLGMSVSDDNGARKTARD